MSTFTLCCWNLRSLCQKPEGQIHFLTVTSAYYILYSREKQARKKESRWIALMPCSLMPMTFTLSKRAVVCARAAIAGSSFTSNINLLRHNIQVIVSFEHTCDHGEWTQLHYHLSCDGNMGAAPSYEELRRDRRQNPVPKVSGRSWRRQQIG